jgi:hypothetical protein
VEYREGRWYAVDSVLEEASNFATREEAIECAQWWRWEATDED